MIWETVAWVTNPKLSATIVPGVAVCVFLALPDPPRSKS
jgi:hypothetical protein